jgi:hypothetical protein
MAATERPAGAVREGWYECPRFAAEFTAAGKLLLRTVIPLTAQIRLADRRHGPEISPGAFGPAGKVPSSKSCTAIACR